MRALVLASTSPYRRELLARLGLPFTTAYPGTDERPMPGESAGDRVRRLAEAKARAVADAHPGAVIIGSDQLALAEGQVLGKPGGHARAVAQLSACAGRTVQFLTALCVLDTAGDRVQVDTVPFRVHFRALSPAQIEGYLLRERPYDAAGSFKSEGLGIALFERMEGEDPTALVGLPLIRLVRMLAAAGLDVLLEAGRT
jgi:MAF protein